MKEEALIADVDVPKTIKNMITLLSYVIVCYNLITSQNTIQIITVPMMYIMSSIMTFYSRLPNTPNSKMRRNRVVKYGILVMGFLFALLLFREGIPFIEFLIEHFVKWILIILFIFVPVFALMDAAEEATYEEKSIGRNTRRGLKKYYNEKNIEEYVIIVNKKEISVNRFVIKRNKN